MFNFHKPRTYRSTEGCCICKAKSSSSRFTDSRKYERDIMQCFDLKYPRQGEICNACVLLVKRYKRLPVGSKRNWSHVVDAKAGIGPGCSKIQTKYKSERISSRAALANNALLASNSLSVSSSSLGGGSAVANTSNALNVMSYMPEKYTKIYKKSKKIKDKEASAISGHSSKRKSTNNGWSQSSLQSLPTTPDSFDSDYEDARIIGSLSGGSGTVVQFQTQTRASAYRAQAAAEARKRLVKMGTKRRKLLTPSKNRRSTADEESIQFCDENEWQERKTCCGMLYECAALGGALLLDIDNYKPCEQHRPKADERQNDLTQTISENKNTTVMPLQKTIKQTVPAVVQLQTPQLTSVLTSSTSSCPSLIHNTISSFKATSSPATTTTATATPVLKKHHLFFKRQSECFPQGDIVTSTHNTSNNDINSSNSSKATGHVVDIIKTEPEFNFPNLQQYYPHVSKSSSCTSSLQRHSENINSAISASNTTTISMNSLTSSALSISVTPSTSSLCSSTTMPQMPKHSLAKVTTISPTLVSSSTTTNSSSNALSLAKPNGFMHKIKAADSGKIVKHTLEKFNTAVKLKTTDIQDIKPIVKTVDKSYILAKAQAQANVISINATNSNAAAAAAAQYQSLAAYNVATQQQPPLTASLSAPSPTSSTSSTSSSSTKFSDNSSDSGFDENLLDRKSASPLQEDCENKLLSRPGVQTMFLASGVQIQGQPQNVVLTGNEVAAKILQNRKYSPLTTSTVTPNPRSNNHHHHHPTTTAVKIAQISTNPLAASSSSSSLAGATSMSLAAQAKMRAIYNNNNTIQHENGITTIVPASSLAASTQTAAMQNIAPSTVTITPAPPVGTTQFNTQNIISRKLTTANIINLQSNTNISNNSLNNITTNNNHHHHQHHHNLNVNNANNANVSSSAANQKIILLKASSNSTTVTPATNYNHLHTTTTTLSSGGGGGLGITR